MAAWIILVVLLVMFKVYQKVSCGMCTSGAKLTGKVAIVTGANSGIGFETAKDLARRGARVVLACRDDARGKKARDDIIKATGNESVLYKQLNLASLDSVRSFASEFTSTEKRLDILINNAGAASAGAQSVTEDGIITEMQVNHFAPFLLTNLLLPLLKSSAPSRIVNVSSCAHFIGTSDLEKLNTRNHFNYFRVYCNSKLCNVLFANELSRRLGGSGVVANSLHPGAVSSNIYRNTSALMRLTSYLYNRLLFKSEWEGAQTSLYAAVSPEAGALSGQYFVDCARGRMSPRAEDPQLAGELWHMSAKLVHLESTF